MSAHVDGIVRDVAKGIQADMEHLTAEMTSMFVDVIPEFRHDDAVQRLMVASTSSNLTAIIDMLALNISLGDITVPPAAAEYARRFAQHDLSLEALLRAYRLGEHMFVQRAMTAIRRLELPMDEALAATSRIALLTNSYIDQVIEGLIDIYENERRRWDARSDATRAAQVRAVLDTEGLDLASAEKMLSTSLRGWHLAAIIWTGPGPDGHTSAELRAGAAMLAAATGKTPLTISADEQTCWTWISSVGRPTLDVDRLGDELRAHPELRIAIGDPSPGLTGFRQTFRDAQRARNVAATGADPHRALVLHSQVALAGLLVDHLPDVRAWAGRVLGDLMHDDDATVRLRETLQAFLDARGSFTDAAARMHVHKNTVHYRVRKAEELLGHPLTENRLDIEVALLACTQLGIRYAEGRT
ncbi:helix-turn-helix domain-containing protein [Streptomyces sp. NY05-11A]|uniref:helix-turn-helix domain-containing protein n=1 Tax=Streptomyces soliscabiei TaxID=588897 RepID=UPI00299FC2E4|nr:helix-turn-helix domain-containing protein [Streptomyces sp. NY05-11A]MDX2683499.1 helix-turn-helix domain-containing protein [Streptomyces sp. NY05-11A]